MLYIIGIIYQWNSGDRVVFNRGLPQPNLDPNYPQTVFLTDPLCETHIYRFKMLWGQNHLWHLLSPDDNLGPNPTSVWESTWFISLFPSFYGPDLSIYWTTSQIRTLQPKHFISWENRTFCMIDLSHNVMGDGKQPSVKTLVRI